MVVFPTTSVGQGAPLSQWPLSAKGIFAIGAGCCLGDCHAPNVARNDGGSGFGNRCRHAEPVEAHFTSAKGVVTPSLPRPDCVIQAGLPDCVIQAGIPPANGVAHPRCKRGVSISVINIWFIFKAMDTINF